MKLERGTLIGAAAARRLAIPLELRPSPCRRSRLPSVGVHALSTRVESSVRIVGLGRPRSYHVGTRRRARA